MTALLWANQFEAPSYILWSFFFSSFHWIDLIIILFQIKWKKRNFSHPFLQNSVVLKRFSPLSAPLSILISCQNLIQYKMKKENEIHPLNFDSPRTILWKKRLSFIIFPHSFILSVLYCLRFSFPLWMGETSPPPLQFSTIKKCENDYKNVFQRKSKEMH